MKTNYLKGISTRHHWQGKWIWGIDDGKQENSFYYFRKEFDIDDVEDFLKDGIKLFITADTRYQLYLNGSFLGEGSLQSQPYFMYYDSYQSVSEDSLDDNSMTGNHLTVNFSGNNSSGDGVQETIDSTYNLPVESFDHNIFKEGKNCLAIIVNHTGVMPDTRGGLLLEMVDGSGNTIIKSDQSWMIKRADAWQSNTYHFQMNKVTTHQEFFDARKVPAGWKEPGFTYGDGWQPAKIIGGRISNKPPAVNPWSCLVPRDIPFMEKRKVLPEAITRTEEALHINNRMRGEDLSIVLSAPGKELQYSTIQKVENLTKVEGTTIIQNSTNHLDHVFDGIYDPCILLDFGRVITGFVELKLDGVAGGMVDIGYAERLIDDRFNNAIEGQFADRYTMVDGVQTFRSFTWKGFRYIKLRFHNCFEPVKIDSVKSIITTYPFEEKGGFSSDDRELEQTFDISRYTLRLCSQEFIMDTPWREQGQWLGDVSAVTLGGIYSCFGDTKLPAKFLRQSAENQHPTGLLGNMTNTVSHNWENVIPDYSLWWIMALWHHYQYTGNQEWIHTYYPHVIKILQAYIRYIDGDGLLTDMPYWVFVDWADVEKEGKSAALNAIFYGTLATIKEMALFKDDSYTVEMVDELRQDLKENFTNKFYDHEKGCLVDAVIDGIRSDKISEHANTAAIYWDLIDKSLEEEIIDNLYVKKTVDYTEAQPFFTTVVLQALDRAGYFNLALDIIRERWGRRMIAKGATSTYEEWGINGSWRTGDYMGFLRSLSHAWSAHPAEFLIKNLIGLEIMEPGCGKVKVSPVEVDFNYEVEFPTLKGLFKVKKCGKKISIDSADEIEIII